MKLPTDEKIRISDPKANVSSLGEFIGVLRDRWMTAVLVFLLVFCGVFWLSIRGSSEFEAHAMIRIADESMNKDALAELGVVETRANTDAEIEVMRSFRVAQGASKDSRLLAYVIDVEGYRTSEALLRRFGLGRDPCRFSVTLVEPSVPERSGTWRVRFDAEGEQVTILGAGSTRQPPVEISREELASSGVSLGSQRLRVKVVDGEPAGIEFELKVRTPGLAAEWLHGLASVEKVGKWTGIVQLGFVGPDPVLARDAANALAQSYIDQKQSTRTRRFTRRLEWLERKIAEIDVLLRKAVLARDEYITTHGAVMLDEQANSASRKVQSLLMEKLAQEQVLEEERAALAELSEGGDPSYFLAAHGISSDALTQALADRLIGLRSQRLALIKRDFTEDLPTVKELDAQISAAEELMQQRNDFLRGKVVAAVNRKLASIETRIKRIDAEIAKANVVIESLPERQRDLAKLLREVGVQEHSLEFLQRVRAETGIAVAGAAINAEIVDLARTPGGPMGSAAFRGLLAGIVLAIMASLLAVYIRHVRDDLIRDPLALERAVGLRMFAAIPEFKTVRRKDRKGLETALAAHEIPGSVIAESYRTIRANLRFSEDGERIRTLTITSAMPSEGKTVTTMNMGVVLATGRNSVVIVDADLRRPRVHEHLGGERGPGLSEVLLGDASVDDVIRESKIPGLSFIPAGAASQDPAALLEGKRFGEMFAELKERFDYVLIDVPPVLAVADAASFFRSLDAVLLVARAGRCRATAVDRARETVVQLGGNVVGVVLNGLDARRAARRAYGGEGYYGYYGYYGYSDGSQS